MNKTKIRKIMTLLVAATMISSSVPTTAYASSKFPEDDVVLVAEELMSDDESINTGNDSVTIDGINTEENMDINVTDTITVSDNTTYDHFYTSSDLPDNDVLFNQYINTLIEEHIEEVFPANNPDEIPNDQISRKSRLSGNDLKVYEYMLPLIKKVADGDRTSTTFQIPVTALGIKQSYSAHELGLSNLQNENATLAQKSLIDKVQFSLNNVFYALLADAPYELYWFDKTQGAFTGNLEFICYDNTIYYANDIQIKMAVAKAYSTGNYEIINNKNILLNTNTGKTAAASNAVSRAISVVNSYKSESDYNKLKAYKEWICEAVSYDHDAVNNSTTPYGDPWQLIYAFDNDPNTNIVCEGYSKAFKLLCDLSSFKSSLIDCYIMTGTMSGGTGAGGHMWNTVLMDDGKYYIADITNCDAKTIGNPDKLFLRGYSGIVGSADTCFYITCSSKSIKYIYDPQTLSQYSSAERTLSNKDYIAGSTPKPTPKPTSKYDIAKDIDDKINVICDTSAKYSKLGAKPVVSITYDGMPLFEGLDYSLSYLYNTQYRSVNSKKQPTVRIRGIGEYKGTITRVFDITKAYRSDIEVVVADKIYKTNAKKGYFKSTPKITESGRTLTKGKEISRYSKKDIKYYYAGTDIEIPDTEILDPYTEIEVRITATIPESSPFESGDFIFSGTYRIIPSDKNLSKARVKVNSPGYVTYSDSNNISINTDDFSVSIRKNKVYESIDTSAFKIVSVVLNSKKTSATVTIAGIGEYGGTKKFTVRLKPIRL